MTPTDESRPAANGAAASGAGAAMLPPRVPHARLLRVDHDLRRGVRTVTVACPYCRRRHVHGVSPSNAVPVGSRLSHCIDRTPEPYLIGPVE